MNSEAQRQNRSLFEMSSVMALSAIADIPQKTRWLSASARVAVGKTGSIVAGVLLGSLPNDAPAHSRERVRAHMRRNNSGHTCMAQSRNSRRSGARSRNGFWEKGKRLKTSTETDSIFFLGKALQ